MAQFYIFRKTKVRDAIIQDLSKKTKLGLTDLIDLALRELLKKLKKGK